jgi:peptidoglycan/xylan/chitin deacetylase (PgdA/CDA1 family)
LAVVVGAFLGVSVLASWSRPAGGPSIHDQQAAVANLLALGYPVYCGGDRGKAVALTIDDGPGPWTAPTLEILERYGAIATFFDLGSHVIHYPGLTRREAREGVVGDHSWSHPVLTTLSQAAIFQELAHTKKVIVRRAGPPPAWLFRPPYGASDTRVDAISRRLGMLTVLWDLAPDDGATDPTAISSYVYADARPGSIILLHENNNQGVTPAALAPILS